VRWDLDLEPGPRAIADAEAVPVPAEYADLRARDPRAARVERDAVAAALERHLAGGRIVVGFDRERSAYLLGPGPAA
jgi:hypothetical protein